MTLHPKWKWSIQAQVFSLIVALYTVLTPPFLLLKYVFQVEVDRAIECSNEKNQNEHERIKSVIIKHHPESYAPLYPTRGGSSK